MFRNLRACPKGQIRGSLVIVLVLAMADVWSCNFPSILVFYSHERVLSFRRGAYLTPRVRGCWQ
jgi:hypothetical protein